ncbi:AdoMet-homocysteine methyltransferase [Ceratobasidium sp. UAMH 11750]|nr:AdoMet-homocysteine methyltransferase [Ceratobasidium sp. UAMH 11750]
MTLLANENPTIRIPPWWISFNFPEGVLPEQNSTGMHYSAADAVRVCFEQAAQPPVSTPSAFGINCSRIKHIGACLQAASKALEQFTGSFSNESYQLSLSRLGFPEGINSGPALVLYPNGGRTYVPSTMTWLPPSPTIPELESSSEAHIWAKKLVAAVIEGVPPEASWSGLIIGGCCKTGPDHLTALKDLF